MESVPFISLYNIKNLITSHLKYHKLNSGEDEP
jgi:hypothetical protein